MPASDEVTLATAPCMFCDIAAGRMASDLAFGSDEIVAFYDVNPQAPVHILVIPKEHISGVGVVESGHEGLLGRLILAAVEISPSSLRKRASLTMFCHLGRLSWVLALCK